MTNNSDEFHLLGGSPAAATSLRRPPWALPEPDFIRVCDHCGDCVAACPEHILINGRGGYPQVDFSNGGCTFCGECARVCSRGGLLRDGSPPWDLKAFIARSCLAQRDEACDVCAGSCPTAAIHLRQQVGGPPVPLLDPGLCNGCGACVPACPAAAINLYGSMQGSGLLS